MNARHKFVLKNRSSRCRILDRGRHGFTLVELLVVIATVAVLGTILLPALAGTRPDGQAFQCQNNLRRLTLGWLMYQGDNGDRLMDYKKWVYGTVDWTASEANTNVGYLLNSNSMAAYVKSVEMYKCPSDTYKSAANPGDRVRSVSLDGALDGSGNSGPVKENANGRTYIQARKVSDLNTPGPARIFVILDEHPDSINDGVFMLNPGYAASWEYWRDLPASHHNGAGSLSFADGHTEIHRWMEQQNRPSKISTILPVLYQNYSDSLYSPWGSKGSAANKDYEWLDDRMPYR